MANNEQLQKVALYCDEYRQNENPSFQSSVDAFGGEIKSCKNCAHFTSDEKCDIDLVDKVLSSMAMELDLK
ncbi:MULTISPECIES: hypothetical protein [Tissierellales]|jgi:recombinational DNA repair protein RecR|uniref:Uncharacterized protein n=1 Tax=Acidilutibacter cellobiosedens TaxID=2507161 RepID=A0A410Q9U6_9FIRM|nr:MULTISPECIES: hypothetical protein [Tissierellales]MBE6083117.1 hypothetical protein [Tissierellaceae bacterium]QAT60765.1 hypothetical protein EQM13_03805 [Acidilutibacter cellobiosedens]SCL87556.1 hypothetical protein PP176A_1327 [Sporanaerobacter sp. PP17-6a]